MVLTLNVTFSIGVFPFRLHEKTMPMSVPHMNFVGIVVSYSNTDTPYDRDSTCSSVRSGSM